MNIGIITGASSGMGKEFVKLTMQNHLELDEIWVIARRKERLEAWSDLYKETASFVFFPLIFKRKKIWIILERHWKKYNRISNYLFTVRDLVLWEGFRRFLWKSRLRW